MGDIVMRIELYVRTKFSGFMSRYAQDTRIDKDGKSQHDGLAGVRRFQ
jgi:galactitol-specific phosphotransferase system IIC component